MKIIDKKEKASSIILVTSDNKIILQKRDLRKDIFFPGYWGLIGGAAIDGENATQCIMRECYEETGLMPKQVIYLFNVNEHCLETVFLYRIESVNELKCYEGERLCSFSIDNIKGIKISDYHYAIIERFINEYWKEYII